MIANAKEIILNLKKGVSKDILQLGAGKFVPINDDNFWVNVDISYPTDDNLYRVIEEHGSTSRMGTMYLVKSDIFNFCDSYPFKFNLIIANRIFEHMFYDDGSIGRLLAACHALLAEEGKLLITVPNHYLLAQQFIRCEESTWLENDNTNDILIMNTEFCNTKCDPHGSIWTPNLATFYIESEGVWDIETIFHDVNWEGRNCYMSIICKKKS